MLYRLDLLSLPILKAAYTVVRKTIWDISDSQNILILIKKGSCQITMDGTKHLLNEGDAFFIPGGKHYRREPINDEMCTLCYAHFVLQSPMSECSSQEARNELSEIHKTDVENVIKNRDDFTDPNFTVYIPTKLSLGADAPKAFEIFEETQNTQRKDSLSRNITASLNLCRLLTRLSNICIKQVFEGEDKIEYPASRKLRRALIYIQTHISEPISLDVLSNVCHISKQQLIRYFKSELGTTPIAYINNLKVSRTKEYLQRHPEIPINEVCAELGFEDPLYFSRLFSKIYGESPSKYRQRVRNYKPIKEENT
jgi:AraC-like DNA-binding protein